MAGKGGGQGLLSKQRMITVALGGVVVLMTLGKIMKAKEEAAKDPKAKETWAYKAGDWFGLV